MLNLRFASAFISHSSAHAPLAAKLAIELSTRGVLPWLDKHRVVVGDELEPLFQKATAEQSAVIALISSESIRSGWCDGELAPWLQEAGRVVPIFIGNPQALVRQSRLLSSHWLAGDSIKVAYLTLNQDASDLETAAEQLVRHQFKRLDVSSSPGIVIDIDQRAGNEDGTPNLADFPPSWSCLPWPTLVYRPHAEDKGKHAVVPVNNWADTRNRIVASLQVAAPAGAREVCVTGRAQPALSWLVGTFFDKSSVKKLSAFNALRPQELSIDFSDDRFGRPLPPVDPAKVRWEGGIPSRDPRQAATAFVGNEAFLPQVTADLDRRNEPALFAVKSAPHIRDTEEVIDLACWLTAVANHQPLILYTTLPFHVLVLLPALLKHALGRPVILRDWDGEAQRYHDYPMHPTPQSARS